MGCYISTRDNRLYGALETVYGQVSPVTAANHFEAARIAIQERSEMPRRRDKMGTRTFQGTTSRLRKPVEFLLECFLTSLAGAQPQHSFLVEAALGGNARTFGGGTATLAQGGKRLVMSAPHGLSPHQAVATGTELRFVESLPSPTAAVLNAPLAGVDGQVVELVRTTTIGPARTLPSATLYDFRGGGVQRLVRGAGVDEFELTVAGDYHTMRFSGIAAEMLDSHSFVAGQGGLTSFPAAPTGTVSNGEPVPGHLGQIWTGATPERLYTLTKARVRVNNNLDVRAREFGSFFPSCLVAGEREVTVALEMYSRDATVYHELYQASRRRIPVAMCLQLGERAGQMCGVSLPGFVPEVPEFDDSEERQFWKVGASRAQGIAEDEIHVAFA